MHNLHKPFFSLTEFHCQIKKYKYKRPTDDLIKAKIYGLIPSCRASHFNSVCNFLNFPDFKLLF